MSSVPNKAPNLLAASGAIPAVAGVYSITKASAGAFTLETPAQANIGDGVELTFISETAYDHVIVCGGSPASGLNAANGTLTFGGAAGDSCQLISRNGRWWTENLNGVTVS